MISRFRGHFREFGIFHYLKTKQWFIIIIVYIIARCNFSEIGFWILGNLKRVMRGMRLCETINIIFYLDEIKFAFSALLIHRSTFPPYLSAKREMFAHRVSLQNYLKPFYCVQSNVYLCSSVLV